MARCRDVLDAPMEDASADRPPMPRLAGAITLEAVSLAHADGAFTLGPLDVRVTPGEIPTVSAITPSASGDPVRTADRKHDVAAAFHRSPSLAFDLNDGRARGPRRSGGACYRWQAIA